MTIINPLPYAIANGQAIDAVPVMANFNEILNDVNANAAPASGSTSYAPAAGSANYAPAAGSANYAPASGSVNYAAKGANSDITSLAGLTTPLSVAQGGTGDAGTAWTSAAVGAITASGGTITSANGTIRYKVIGKTCFFSVLVNIVNNGTGSGQIQIVGLPINFRNAGVVVGREGVVNGKACIFIFNGPGVSLSNYDNTYPGVTGASFYVSGACELN